MRTNAYIDGFNLHYGALRKTRYRWLDLGKLSGLLLPRDTIGEIKYFTALVRALPRDPQQPARQQVCLRALRTIPKLSIHYGHYLMQKVWMPRVTPSGAKIEFVQVIKSEEKGSDVNLATHLLHDAYRNACELSVVISNDSDLLEPITVVRRELGKPVGVFNPCHHPSQVLRKKATFFKELRRSSLAKSQFPNTLADEHGTFHKPEAW